MNIFHKVTVQTLKKNKTRTAVTIIGIILSAAMVSAVTTFAASFSNYLLENAIYSNGNWHGKSLEVSYDTVTEVKNSSGIEAAQGVQILGYSQLPESDNANKPYLYVLGTETEGQEMLPVHLTSGRYPRNSGELLLPNHLLSNGGVIYHLGDTLELTLGDRTLRGVVLSQNNPFYEYNAYGKEVPSEESFIPRETRTYQVVGFYERLDYGIEDYSAPGYTALTIGDSSPAEGTRYDLYFRMNNPKDVFSFMEEYGLEGQDNRDVLMYYGVFKYDNFHTTFISLCAIVIGLIMFGSVALIYNAFSISMSERTKQFGLLSSVGATKKQLSGMILYEAIIVSAIGVPLGILSGVGGIWVTLLLLGDKFKSIGFSGNLKLYVSPVSILLAAVIALLTVLISAWIPSRRARRVTAVEAIRQNSDIKIKGRQVRTGKLTAKIFGLPGMLAGKYYKRSRKKYRATIVSLFMSIVLFVSAFSFTQYMAESVETGFGGNSCDLSYVLNANERAGFTNQQVLDLIRTQDTIIKAAGVRSAYENAYIDTDQLTETIRPFLSTPKPDSEQTKLNVVVAFADDVSYLEFLQENRLSADMFMNPDSPRAIALDVGATYNPETHRYEILSFLKNSRCTIEVEDIVHQPGYHIGGTMMDEQGREFMVYVSKENEEIEMRVPLEKVLRTVPIQVETVVYERPYFISNDVGLVLLFPESALPGLFPDWVEEESSAEFLMLSSDHEESETQLKAELLASGLKTENLTNVAAYQEGNRNTITIIRVFCFGFIVLISLISAANVFNTISTNVNLRRRDLAMLRSVGMTKKGFNGMMCYECLLYGTKSLFFGLPVALIVTAMIWQSVSGSFSIGFRIPWLAMGIAAVSVFLVVFVTMLYAMKKVNKNNLLDTLRNENL